MNYYIGFDIGGTKVKHGVLSEDGTILQKGDYTTNCIDATYFIDDMVSTIENYQNSHEISGIAISCPGYIDVKTGYAPFTGAIVAMNGTNIKQLLEERVKLPVEIENDANCVALAEKFQGNAKECNDFICMTIGTGIGGGIFINGQMVRGHQFKGGEFGTMNMNGIYAPFRNMHDSCSTRILISKYKEYKGIPESEEVEGYVIFQEAMQDKNIQQIIDDWLKYLSYGIFTLVCTLNPEKILIGGGISARETLIAEIEEKLEEIPDWKVFRTPLERCHFKNEAGLVGALYHFLQISKSRL